MARTLETANRKPPKEKENYLKVGLKLIPLLETALLILALYQLGFGAEGIFGWLKLGIFGVAAYAVSYLIYRMAIEKGATLNAVGYRPAGVLGGVTVLLVGLAFFLATGPGLTIKPVEESRLGQHNKAIIAYADARNAQSVTAIRLAPVIAAIPDDLDAKTACEEKSSCVSGRGEGGYGSASRMLQTLASRARGIANQISSGLNERNSVQQQLDALLESMNETLANETKNIWVRRAQLRKKDGEVGRILNKIDEAVPTTLVASYAQELRAGVTIPNRPEVSAAINRILNGYARSLEVALAGTKTGSSEKPAFPERTGALDTFAYAAKFAPIFLLAFLIDVAFPISLWAYTIMGLDWGRYRENPNTESSKRERTDLDALTELRAIDLHTNHSSDNRGNKSNMEPEQRRTRHNKPRTRGH